MITDILIQLVTTLIDKGFTLPIYIFLVSQNGNLVCARYEGNPIKGKTKVHVFVEHIEDPVLKLPINSFFVEGTGKSESIKLDPESVADTAEV